MESVSTSEPLNVLFVCTGNSARSIMAEAILSRLGHGKFNAFSAGTHPAGYVQPLALQMLQNAHYDVSGLCSKAWDEFAKPDAPKLDFVFTLCDKAAKEACPVWSGEPITAHWGLADPSNAEGTEAQQAAAFADTMRMLNQWIGIFVNLPIEKLNKEHLADIGRAKAETEA